MFGAINAFGTFMIPNIARKVLAPDSNISGYNLRLSVRYDFITYQNLKYRRPAARQGSSPRAKFRISYSRHL